MTQEHPITPPDELVEQWHRDALKSDPTKSVAQCIATYAARWGADQELEACIDFVRRGSWCSEKLRAARRPKPKSQVEEALASLDGVALPEEAWQAVSAALERLRELEKSND